MHLPQPIRFKRMFQAAFMALLLISVASVQARSHGHASRSGLYFQDCHTVMADPAYRALAQYVDRIGHRFNPDDLSANLGKCYALNASEFVVIPKTTHSYLGSLYYCEFKRRGACTPYQYNAQLPGLRVVREFNGSQGKHVVLLDTQYAEHGFYAHDFYVFYLAPNAKDPKSDRGMPFTLQHLVGVKGLNGGLCGEGMDNRHATTTDFNGAGYRIDHLSSPRLTLTFDLIKKSCKGGEQVKFQQQFIYKDGAFVEKAAS
jgi:hypothetical protein